jgi:hypothetical protein
MLLHAPVLAEVAGLKRYVQTPGVRPLSDGRGGTLGGEREDTVTYVIGAAGRYQLPEITYQWRDATSGEVHQTKVPAVELEATAGAYQAPFSISDDLRAMGHQARLRLGGHWLLVVAVVLGAGALGWGLRARWQALWQRLRRWRPAASRPGSTRRPMPGARPVHNARRSRRSWMRCTCGCAAAVASPDCCVVGRKFPTR